MYLDWRARAALERRMRHPAFRPLSCAMGRAVLAGSIAPLVDEIERTRASQDVVLCAIRCQGVAGHLAALHDLDASVLSTRTSDAIRAEARQIARRSARLAEDLASIDKTASQSGLACSPLKGTFLRLTDPAPATRPSADIDLLIEPGDEPAWTRVMQSQGYDVVSAGRHLVCTHPDAAPVDVEGDHPDHPRPVELHTQLSEPVLGRVVDITEAYRADVGARRLAGLDVQAPGQVALALHLVLHAAAAMLSRGLRIVQLLDLRHVADAEATRRALRDHLGPAAWAVMHLAERDLPGLIAAPLRTAFADVAPTGFQRRRIEGRPGVLAGDPLRWRTLTGELMLAGTRPLVHRLADAMAMRGSSRAEQGQLPSRARAIGTFLRSVVDRRR